MEEHTIDEKFTIDTEVKNIKLKLKLLPDFFRQGILIKGY